MPKPVVKPELKPAEPPIAAPVRKLDGAVIAADDPTNPAPKDPPAATAELTPAPIPAPKAPAAAPTPKYPIPCQKLSTLFQLTARLMAPPITAPMMR